MSRLFRSRWFAAAIALAVLLGGTGIWALLHPGGIWLQHWRVEPSVVSSRFIFGPYPLKDDFPVLKRSGVTTIISLLDPDLPYEKLLLAQERKLAQLNGMQVRNFPMASILGQSFGKDYLANSKAAAQAAIDSPGVAYIHCYLGLHRSENVRKFLEAYASTKTATYTSTSKSERSADLLALDHANIAFLQGHPEESLRELATIKDRTYRVTLLEAWSNYRLGRIEPARVGFAKVLSEWPDQVDALGGLGYCALRSGDLAEAGLRFNQVLSKHPDDAQAIEGLGYLRYQEGRYAEARSLFERALKRHPENTDVRDALGKIPVTP